MFGLPEGFFTSGYELWLNISVVKIKVFWLQNASKPVVGLAIPSLEKRPQIKIGNSRKRSRDPESRGRNGFAAEPGGRSRSRSPRVRTSPPSIKVLR